MPIQRPDVKLGASVGVAIAAITLLHYLVAGSLGSHIVYRNLYYVPILLAALRFGKRGGLLAAAAITPIYAPRVFMGMLAQEPLVGNMLEIVFFFVFAFAVGTYADLRRSYRRKIAEDTMNVSVGGIGHKILVCVDESGPGQQTALCAGDLFGRDPETSIVLLCAAAEPNPDFFSNQSELGQELSRVNATAAEAVQHATASLKKYGIPESRISTRVVSEKGGRVSDRILQEQREGDYSLIIVGKHQLTRAQEFLFGSLAIRLARDAPCPVLIVGGQKAKYQSIHAKTASPVVQ
jgi:nucleotide-binding universal stress UspA family protein